MLLEARQKAAKATTARSTRANVSNRCAKTIPTKIARFFVHCRGRRADSNANMRLDVPGVGDVFVGADKSAVGAINRPLRSLCFAAVIVFSKNTRSLQRIIEMCSAPSSSPGRGCFAEHG